MVHFNGLTLPQAASKDISKGPDDCFVFTESNELCAPDGCKIGAGKSFLLYKSSTQARHGSPSRGHSPSTHLSDKKTKKNKDRKSPKNKKKKQNEALLGTGSQFDNDEHGAAGSGESYPQDLVVD
ncbi:hypothetical protein PGQ11_007573 [Apiospora arundinis]|uniref:Uncharacterized protein n=1 Tax=Apiospora arundinis TaxID=335852 RepID=A0ABR2IWK0_9PEZI